jgi:hypothetical protein
VHERQTTLCYVTGVLQADQYSMSLYDGMDLGDALCYTSLGAASKLLAVKFFVGGCAMLLASIFT